MSRSWLLGLLLLALPAMAAAQAADAEPRLQAWLGCWQPADVPAPAEGESAAAPTTCLIPIPGAAAVERITIVDGGIAERERVALDVQRPSNEEGCTGWESMTASPDGRRIYRQAEHTCAGDLQRRSSGLMAILPSGEWLDVQSVTAGGHTGVFVVRHREVNAPDALPEARVVRQERARSIEAARLAAAARLTTADVIEASRQADPAVIEAWLVEREQGFAIDARQLIELADAGVPERVIDLMVALSYPRVFAINRPDREAEFLPEEGVTRPDARRPGPMIGLGGWYPAYGYPYYGYGYGYNRGYGYWGHRPVVIVVRDSGDEAGQPRARAVKGQGYTRSGTSSAGSTPSSSQSGTSAARSRPSSSQPSASSGSSSSGSASSGSSSSGSTRTAKPRNPDE